MRNSHGRRNGARRSAITRTLSKQGGRIAGAVQELGRVTVNGAGKAVSSLGEGGRKAVQAIRRAKTQVRNYITGNPTGSVLIALGVGALFGYMMRRRRD